MPDVWATVAELDPTTQERMADVLETRGADPRQREMRQSFLADIAFPAGANVLEVGCGTGVLTRVLAGLPAVDRVVGVDIATSLLDKARELAAGIPDVTFEQADARSLPFADERFDVVVFDSTLSTFPSPSAPSPKPSACCARTGCWPRSTATTRPPPCRSSSTTRCRPAWTR